MIPFVCRFFGASPSVGPPAVEPAASVCVCVAESSPSAALPAAGRSPAAAERTGDAAELNRIDHGLSKSQICIPLPSLCRNLLKSAHLDLQVNTIEIILEFPLTLSFSWLFDAAIVCTRTLYICMMIIY